jgi:hypothetical protein
MADYGSLLKSRSVRHSAPRPQPPLVLTPERHSRGGVAGSDLVHEIMGGKVLGAGGGGWGVWQSVLHLEVPVRRVCASARGSRHNGPFVVTILQRFRRDGLEAEKIGGTWLGGGRGEGRGCLPMCASTGGPSLMSLCKRPRFEALQAICGYYIAANPAGRPGG